MAADVHYTDPSRQTEPPALDEQSTADYVNNLQPIKNQKKKSKRNKIILITLIALAVASAAVYFFVLKKDEPQQPAQQTTSQEQVQEQPVVAETEMYSSQDLNLSFDYPKNWKIIDDTEGLIKAESPVVKLADVNGEMMDGKVVVTFLSAGSEVPAFEGAASATAAQDSEKITYDSPSPNQREQTYLTFASFGGGGLDAVFITGDSGYTKDQIIPESDVKKIEPIISVRFYSCADGQCAGEGSGSYAISLKEWSENINTQAAVALLKSLRVE